MQAKRYHPLTFVTFLLAVLLVIPMQIELVHGALVHDHSAVEAITSFVATSLVLIIPLLYAKRETSKHPERFKPRLLSKITWTIVALSMALSGLNITAYLTYAG
ncbi:MAG TPA: hypothetical protein VFG04_26530 [Planctomycetaceae bacterium]|nr:hypothetical protein [Planctomycetaceae bacterium]